MGTRADFYVGDGVDAEWIGSVAWDGDRWAEDPTCFLMQATDEKAFRLHVAKAIEEDESATVPSDGWPWPWEDSRTTDFAYCFVGDRVDVYCFGSPWERDSDVEHPRRNDWPDMTERQNAPLGKHSGVIIVAG